MICPICSYSITIPRLHLFFTSVLSRIYEYWLTAMRPRVRSFSFSFWSDDKFAMPPQINSVIRWEVMITPPYILAIQEEFQLPSSVQFRQKATMIARRTTIYLNRPTSWSPNFDVIAYKSGIYKFNDQNLIKTSHDVHSYYIQKYLETLGPPSLLNTLRHHLAGCFLAIIRNIKTATHTPPKHVMMMMSSRTWLFASSSLKNTTPESNILHCETFRTFARSANLPPI